ncbi:DUF2125 domain-containing protein [Phaeobacter gallaeciensis]|uniref:DUF2125 domain-containing protein n=2 Tax=Phaeobacter gallaeciensis TaxID=60890 RepID=A0AAC9Z757_9RHOB|nr:DUF2125 domain-containing protein [Phaeobacter gallaeciensis]AHD08645.1 Uncharacterized protein in bacteria [Phaeobacter gallaeciensis DSM 26640]ATE91911.1 putative protein in bacteria [Phaeobacter gallaeciensis]ATE98265.1 putative protein in bacteria [Phaeobacter gallaeciensis]ATF00527.1 putative protein in bacteria [Phaeobacter gallaeciensis]ATF04958.1 putative protein in bacteria [Phaeobacter gallaeciensis]
MIRWTKLLLIAACVWSLYWAIAGWGLRQGLDGWFAEQQRQGWQADYAALHTTGFPLHHHHRITTPALADPGTGLAWRADWLDIRSLAIWPGTLTLRLPPTPQKLSYFDATTTIQADGLRADLQLAPGSALDLEELRAQSNDWSLKSDDKLDLSGETFALEMSQIGDPAQYQISARAEGVLPHPLLRQRLAATQGVPDRLDVVAIDMEVHFDTGWDRNAIELRRPQPREITLHLAEARWGPMRIKATGDISLDETGLPEGDLALQVENWQDILQMAETAGNLPPRVRAGIEQVLQVFAGLGGNHRDLDLPLTLKSGYVALGPLPIGPAPRLVLR